jgi:hypothetical protein
MDEENKETQSTQGTEQTLEAITAQLEEEKKAKAAAEASLAEKDALVADLQAQLKEAKQTTESLRAQGVAIAEARDRAIASYLEAVRLANPAIPGDVIAGGTIEEIDASLTKATSIAESVRASLEARTKETRVPAGAPTRGDISLEGLSPREKIAAGIQQKQGGM